MLNCNDEEDTFFDAYDDIGTSSEGIIVENKKLEFHNYEYDLWASEPMSIQERREKFLKEMGFNELVQSHFGCSKENDESLGDFSEKQLDFEKIRKNSRAASDSLSSRDVRGLGDSACCTRDLDSGEKLIVQDTAQDEISSMFKEISSDNLLTIQKFKMLVGLSHSDQKLLGRESSHNGKWNSSSLQEKERKLLSWWRSFRKRSQVLETWKHSAAVDKSKVPRPMRIRVQQRSKRCKEASALYMGQEIRAHRGLIRTMKFSPCGKYLASGGEDCIACIWEIREIEASCRCLPIEESSKFVHKLRDIKLMHSRCGLSTPILIPEKVFWIEEKPLQKLSGHTSDILDLSWSKSNYLLTSSKDKTVRLWKVGCSGCLEVFQQNDYVTCVQFNPVDDRYFISGSIDGKVRIWRLTDNRVVDWIDVRDIVTAICHQPDGKGFVVGSIRGNCRFYCYSANNLELNMQLSIPCKKKSTTKRITSLQFSPEESKKIMVTSVDSKVRIFNGVNVINKFKGLRRVKSQFNASFTSDGKHVISVGDDSHVYIWNYYGSEADRTSSRGVKSIRSFEHFFSEGATIAVPWPGMDYGGTVLSEKNHQFSSLPKKILQPHTWLRDPDCFSLGTWLFSDVSSRVSATWPEEKLPSSSEPSLQSETRHRLHCHLHHYPSLTSIAAAWGLVILTGGVDGTIRSFHNYGLPVRL